MHEVYLIHKAASESTNQTEQSHMHLLHAADVHVQGRKGRKEGKISTKVEVQVVMMVFYQHGGILIQ